MNKEKRLLNKKTIVTGGARGIGAGIVKRLYSEGAEIIIADLKEVLANKLIQEIDEYWLNNPEESYDSFYELPFMTQCITETLRMWPALANGTYRELEKDESIHGIDNEMITIPKGRGSLFFFDSRMLHRAMTVTKGLRKSLIIWAVGPRWK